MYDDTIHILQLSHLKDKIEHIEVRAEKQSLEVMILLKRSVFMCPKCESGVPPQNVSNFR